MPARTHDYVLSWIRHEIVRGNLKLGDRLPGERALAEQLSVSRTAVREALHILGSLGIVRSGVGSGPSSGTTIIAEPGVALGSAVSIHLATGHISAENVMEARVVVESWAAARSTLAPADVETAQNLLSQMDDPALSVADFLQKDASFHVLLASSSSNPLISALMGALRESIGESTLALSEDLPDWPRTVDRLQHEHREILRALVEGRKTAAASQLQLHIEGYFNETLGAQHPEAPVG
jgi:GntR family transcriptional repressor for pyruvate dehydrogenase complex